jgi:DNA polymerase-3 subunit delta
MAKKNFEKLKQDLEKKKIAPLYLFSGPQEELKREALKLITSILIPPGSEAFNLDQRKAPEAEIIELQNLILTAPWGAEKRIVLVSNVDKLELEKRHRLAELVEKVPDSTCLVLTAEKIPEAEILSKAVARKGEIIEFSSFREDKLEGWIIERVEKEGKKIDQRTAESLAQIIGDDLALLSQEIGKLATYVGESSTIREEDMLTQVSASPEFKAYQLIDYVAVGDVKNSLEVVRDVMLTDGYAGIITNRLVQDFFYIWRIFTYTGSRSDFPSLAAHLSLGRQAFRVSKYLNCSRAYNQAKVEQALKKACLADFALRHSPVSPRIMVEELVLELCILTTEKRYSPALARS